jgi:cobalt-zinc-cadmium efflux system outer membrane protein
VTRAALPILAGGLLAGCASVNPQPAFVDVRDKVEERTGREAHWVRGEQDADVALARVRALLAEELTAERAAEVALVNNRQLQATLQELGISQADYAQATRVSNPDFHSFVRFPDREPKGTNLELSVFQDFLDVLVQPLRKKLGAAQLEQAKLHVGDAMLRLMAETKAAHFTLVAREQLVTRLELIRDVNQTAAEFARRQHEAGNINDLELLNHEAAYNQSRVDLALAQVDVRKDRERLNRLMGLWGPDTAWRAEAGLSEIPAQEVPFERLESLAVSQRLDLDAARWGVNLVGRALALKNKTRYFPIGVQIGIQREQDTEGQRVVGPSLELLLPIFDTGKAQVARLQAEYQRAQRQLEALAVNARSEVREARDSMIAARDLAAYYRAVLLPQRVAILDQTQRHYNMMLKGAYDLLLAKQAEAQTERAYIDAWRDYWIARTELERAVGGRLPAAKESPHVESPQHESAQGGTER